MSRKPSKPETRIEDYLDVMTGGNAALPQPILRIEFYYAFLAGMTVELPQPILDDEKLLAKICGMEVEAPTYIPGLFPRLYAYMAKKGGQDVQVPDPILRLECYWYDYTHSVQEYTGAVPVAFVADGTPLLDYIISGKTVQSGTPTPDNPIMPQGCGDLETSGAKVGQYKIPISSANTTTSVYLGEVQTTRKVKKLVLTGEESGWKKNIMTSSNAFYRTISGYYHYRGYCTHYATVYGTQAAEGVFFGSNINFLTALSDNIDTIDKWINYLRQQYAAGTPVTVWYVLATETTGIVNEPLMKIGDYADTLSMEQAGVQIPTANGSTTLDVETTVKPSEIYIKYRGWAVAALSSLSAEVSSPEGTPEEVNPEETEEEENGSEDVSLQHEFEAVE